MTGTAMEPGGVRADAASQLGPVLLATKPFVGLDAPVEVARWLSRREERALQVVSVLEQSDSLALAAGMAPAPSEYYRAECAALAEQIRRELATEEKDSEGLQIAVIDGDSTHGIVDAARRCDARVIVVGTGQHGTIGRYIYGERAIEIVKAADRPVLVVPRGAHAGPVSIAVVAVDFSDASVRAARAILPMLSEGARMILVHVRTSDDPSHERVTNQGIADQFAAFRRRLPSLPAVTVETRSLRGEPVRTILEYASASGAGLIACGRLGHSFVERVFVGSVSAALVRQASCPVLVAPSPIN